MEIAHEEPEIKSSARIFKYRSMGAFAKVVYQGGCPNCGSYNLKFTYNGCYTCHSCQAEHHYLVKAR